MTDQKAWHESMADEDLFTATAGFTPKRPQAPVTPDTLRAEVERLLTEAFTKAESVDANNSDFTAALTIAREEVDVALQPFLDQQAAVVAERDRLRRQDGDQLILKLHRFATPAEVAASADRMTTRHRKSLEKLGQHAALLAKVRELPSPILSEPEWREAAKCVWCAAEWTFPDNHPANGCLYVLAHAEPQP